VHDRPLKPLVEPRVEIVEVVALNATDEHNSTVVAERHGPPTNRHLAVLVKERVVWFVKEFGDCSAVILKACLALLVFLVCDNPMGVEVGRWYNWFMRESRKNYLLQFTALFMLVLVLIVKFMDVCIVLTRTYCERRSAKNILEKVRQEREKHGQDMGQKIRTLEESIEALNVDNSEAEKARENLVLERARLEADNYIEEIKSLLREKASLTLENDGIAQENEGLKSSLVETEKQSSEKVHEFEKQIEELKRNSLTQVAGLTGQLKTIADERDQALTKASEYQAADKERRQQIASYESQIAAIPTPSESDTVPRGDLDKAMKEKDNEIAKLKKSCESLKSEVKDYALSRELSGKDKAQLTKEIKGLRSNESKKDSIISSLEKESTSLKSNLEKSQEKIADLSSAQENYLKAVGKVAGLKTANGNLEKLLGAANGQLSNIKANSVKKEKFDDLEITNKNQAEDLIKTQKLLDDANAQLKKKEAELSQTVTELSGLRTSNDDTSDQLKQKKAELSANTTELSRLRKNNDNANDLLKQKEAELAQLRKANGEAKNLLQHKAAELSQKAIELSELHKANEEKQTKLSELQNEHANLQTSHLETQAQLTKTQDELTGAWIEVEILQEERDEAEAKVQAYEEARSIPQTHVDEQETQDQEPSASEIEEEESSTPAVQAIDESESKVQESSASEIHEAPIKTEPEPVDEPESKVQKSSIPEVHEEPSTPASQQPEVDRMTTHNGLIVPKGPRNGNQTPRSGATAATTSKGLGESRWATTTDQPAVVAPPKTVTPLKTVAPSKPVDSTKTVAPPKIVASPTASTSNQIVNQPPSTPTTPSEPANDLEQSRWANAEAEPEQGDDEKPKPHRGRRGGRKVQHKRELAIQRQQLAAAQETPANPAQSSRIPRPNGNAEVQGRK